MKKHTLFQTALLAFCLVIISCSNDKKGSDRVEEYKKAEEVFPITDKHVRVPSSGFYIIPPPGFTPDSVGQMLVRKSENGGYEPNYIMTSINSAVEGDSLLAVEKAEAESKNQLDKWAEEKLTVGGHPARLYRAKVMYDAMYYSLYFTDGFGKQMLRCFYSIGDSALGEQIHESFKTVLMQSTQYGEASHNQ